MKSTVLILCSLIALLLLTASLAGCDNGDAQLYSHDDASIRFDARKRLIIDTGHQPQATIDAQHRLFIGDRRLDLDAAQQADVARYYEQVIRIRQSGWATGRAGADFAVQAVKTVAAKLASGDLNGIGDAIDGHKQQLLASVGSLCETLARAAAAQDRLASDVPRFDPYAVIKDADIADCRRHAAKAQANN